MVIGPIVVFVYMWPEISLFAREYRKTTISCGTVVLLTSALCMYTSIKIITECEGEDERVCKRTPSVWKDDFSNYTWQETVVSFFTDGIMLFAVFFNLYFLTMFVLVRALKHDRTAKSS